jgi:hypothetical protein
LQVSPFVVRNTSRVVSAAERTRHRPRRRGDVESAITHCRRGPVREADTSHGPAGDGPEPVANGNEIAGCPGLNVGFSGKCVLPDHDAGSGRPVTTGAMRHALLHRPAPILLVCSLSLAGCSRENPFGASRGRPLILPRRERSRPLSADWPLRAGPKSWLHLEA